MGVRLPRWSRRRWAAVVGGVLVVGVVGASAVLFVVPRRDRPRHVDAIVVLGGGGYAPVRRGLELARGGYAPVLALSTGSAHSLQVCATREPGFRTVCFHPDPVSTRGEARVTASLAGRYGWRQILVVTNTDHVFRTRLRFDRCLHASVLVTGVTRPATQWPARIAYEWGALFKALVLQRGC